MIKYFMPVLNAQEHLLSRIYVIRSKYCEFRMGYRSNMYESSQIKYNGPYLEDVVRD